MSTNIKQAITALKEASTKQQKTKEKLNKVIEVGDTVMCIINPDANNPTRGAGWEQFKTFIVDHITVNGKYLANDVLSKTEHIAPNNAVYWPQPNQSSAGVYKEHLKLIKKHND